VSEDTRAAVKSKASARFIERIAKLPHRRGLDSLFKLTTICDWLTPFQLPIEPSHLSDHFLIEQNIPRRAGYLILAMGPATHILQLHSVILVRG
jgi:hypothetical protein